MESTRDLLRIPLESDFEGDTHYSFHILPSDQLRSHHYDEISRLRFLIHDQEVAIAKLSRGANAPMRTRPLEARRHQLINKLRALESGWARIAPVLRSESAKLLCLPRELREKVYGYLYTRSKPVYLELPDIDVRRSMLPRDPFLYLHADIVDPQIAAEAAQVMYDTNTFDMGLTSQFANFLQTDHYGSGIIPSDVIRRIKLRMNCYWQRYARCSHEEFERGVRGAWEKNREARAGFVGLVGMHQLCVLELYVTSSGSSGEDCRDFSAFLKLLKEKGVVVRVFERLDWGQNDSVEYGDVSSKYDTPSQADYDEFARSELAHASPRDLYEYMTRVEEPGHCRVFLEKHYQVFKRYELEETMESLRHARRNILAVQKALSPF
ncbi:hypothetical protein BCR34DRAFT_603740 [Clohesyomyces aquaticus]|uniref:Uncharacterized protein n=1 Tax=Clohesyomyces aquaticus TaxID=1231657 RepID=A0A1Y1ZCF7_9PLEO|nr:hypothetical protein BCR34DRAFT_603740 [Clohesyomyces aquaticus]